MTKDISTGRKRLDVVHSSIAQDDDEYAQALLNFQQSRDVLKQLTVARNFYPVVVPAGFKPNGKGSQKKGNGKGAPKPAGGKGKQSGRSKPKGGKGKGRGSQNIRITNRPKPKAVAKAKGQEPICFGCGKPGQFCQRWS